MVNQRILGIRNIPAEIPRLQSSGVIDCEPRFPVRSDKKTGSRESTRASGGKGVLPMSGGVRRLSWRFVLSLPITSRSARARDMTARPVLETLEGRQLLAVFTGFTHVRNVSTATGVYSLQIIGPGVLKPQPAGGGSFNLKVLGTTADFDPDDHASPPAVSLTQWTDVDRHPHDRVRSRSGPFWPVLSSWTER